jgi:hypothetical protein
MLLFRSEEEIGRWRRQTGRNAGAILTLPQTWQLAQLWYGTRLNEDFRGRTPAEAEKIFAQVGLVSAFWKF